MRTLAGIIVESCQSRRGFYALHTGPGVYLNLGSSCATEMSAAEARELARMLVAKAEKAEREARA